MSKKESLPDLRDASDAKSDTNRHGQVSTPPWKPPGLSKVSWSRSWKEVLMPTLRSSCIAGGQSKQSKPTQLSKDHAISVKGEIQKTVGTRRVIEKIAVPNDSAVPTQSRVVQETALPSDLEVPIQGKMTQKATKPKDASTQRSGILESSGPKNPAVSTQRIWIQKTEEPKAPPVPEGEIQKTVGDRRRVIEKTAVPNDPAVPTQSRVVQETAHPSDLAVSTQRNMTQKASKPKDASVSTQRSRISEKSDPKNPAISIQRKSSQRTEAAKAPPVPITGGGIKKTLAQKTHAPSITRGSTQTSSPGRVSHNKTLLSPSQSEPSSKPSYPVHHITWDGWVEECEPLGQSCFLCEKDFSRGPRDASNRSYLKYQLANFDAPGPPTLPAVDILVCGHAFHSECLQLVMAGEESSDPPCILCLSMA